MVKQFNRNKARVRRHERIRKQVNGTAARPRLDVFRSNKAIYVQLIDDESMKTLASASSKELGEKTNNIEVSARVGTLIAQKAKAANIEEVVFDRGGYLFHGKVKALADAARAEGLKF